MANMTDCKCQWCEGDFKARTADVNRGWAKFCSKTCKAKHQSKHGRGGLSAWERNDEMHEQALYDAFQSHGQDGF
jgi:hypothetical protein